MVDVTRTKAELLAIFAEAQAAGSITEQDLRDFVMTIYDPKDGVTLPAGTISKAPLTLTAGPLLTTPQSGTVEYNAGRWYLTNGSRKSVDLTAGVKNDTTTVINTAAETLVYTHTLPANSLHVGERVLADVSGSFTNASASDDFNIIIKINGVNVHTITRVGGNATNFGWKLQMEGTIRSVGASGSFIDIVRFEDGSSIFTESLITAGPLDTTINTLYEVYVQWGTAKAGNTFSCTQGSITFKH